MRRILKIFFLASLLLTPLVWFYQMGPPTISAGADKLLASTSLANGDTLFLVAHKTGDFVEAYEVSLYRVDETTNVFVAFLGHEEPFWWGASLRPSAVPDKIEIRAFWEIEAVYSIADGSYDYPAKKWVSYPSCKIDGVKIKWPVPEVVRDKFPSVPNI